MPTGRDVSSRGGFAPRPGGKAGFGGPAAEKPVGVADGGSLVVGGPGVEQGCQGTKGDRTGRTVLEFAQLLPKAILWRHMRHSLYSWAKHFGPKRAIFCEIPAV